MIDIVEKRSEHMIYMTKLYRVYIASEGIYATTKDSTKHQTRYPRRSFPLDPQPSTSQTQQAPPEA